MAEYNQTEILKLLMSQASSAPAKITRRRLERLQVCSQGLCKMSIGLRRASLLLLYLYYRGEKAERPVELNSLEGGCGPRMPSLDWSHYQTTGYTLVGWSELTGETVCFTEADIAAFARLQTVSRLRDPRYCRYFYVPIGQHRPAGNASGPLSSHRRAVKQRPASAGLSTSTGKSFIFTNCVRGPSEAVSQSVYIINFNTLGGKKCISNLSEFWIDSRTAVETTKRRATVAQTKQMRSPSVESSKTVEPEASRDRSTPAHWRRPGNSPKVNEHSLELPANPANEAEQPAPQRRAILNNFEPVQRYDFGRNLKTYWKMDSNKRPKLSIQKDLRLLIEPREALKQLVKLGAQSREKERATAVDEIRDKFILGVADPRERRKLKLKKAVVRAMHPSFDRRQIPSMDDLRARGPVEPPLPQSVNEIQHFLRTYIGDEHTVSNRIQRLAGAPHNFFQAKRKVSFKAESGEARQPEKESVHSPKEKYTSLHGDSDSRSKETLSNKPGTQRSKVSEDAAPSGRLQGAQLTPVGGVQRRGRRIKTVGN